MYPAQTEYNGGTTTCRDDQPLANITMSDVTLFFALQGVTLAQVNDTWEFAVLWVRDAITNTTEHEEILDNINSVVMLDNMSHPPSTPILKATTRVYHPQSANGI